jgi:type IV pilus assembly protein PilV
MKTTSSPRSQGGVALLEVMIAILIISFGILGIIGLQANSIAITSDARYRIEASAFAERLVSEMWMNPLNLANYAYPGTGAVPAPLAAWYADLTAGSGALPGAITNKPVVNIAADNVVTITIFWEPPGGSVHNHMVVTNINQNPEN